MAEALDSRPDSAAHPEASPRKLSLRSILRYFLLGVALLWSLAALMLVAARWIDPPTTAVHMERRLQAWIHGKPYRERHVFVPLRQISPDFQHAVIAAEDARFYQHHGFDWHAIQIAAEGDMEGARIRGGSTITQQLVKNLFFGTVAPFSAKARNPRWSPSPNWSSASAVFWSFISTWSSGAQASMVRSRPAVITTEPQRETSAASRPPNSPPFCRCH